MLYLGFNCRDCRARQLGSLAKYLLFLHVKSVKSVYLAKYLLDLHVKSVKSVYLTRYLLVLHVKSGCAHGESRAKEKGVHLRETDCLII